MVYPGQRTTISSWEVGGTSGNTLGGRLAEAGFRVAILEAGGFYEIGDALAAVPASSALEIDSTLRNWNHNIRYQGTGLGFPTFR